MVRIFLALLFLGLPFTAAEAFEFKITSKSAPYSSARLDIEIFHLGQATLTYGILYIPSQVQFAAAITSVIAVRDSEGKRIAPISITTCDVNYVWFGFCQRVYVRGAGPTLISVLYITETLRRLKAAGIEKMLILLATDGYSGREKKAQEIAVENLLEKAGMGRSF